MILLLFFLYPNGMILRRFCKIILHVVLSVNCYPEVFEFP